MRVALPATDAMEVAVPRTSFLRALPTIGVFNPLWGLGPSDAVGGRAWRSGDVVLGCPRAFHHFQLPMPLSTTTSHFIKRG